MARLTRRQALAALGGLAFAATACSDEGRRSVTAPEALVRGEPLSFNVHPLGGRFESLQREALRRLAAPWIRVTLGLVTDVGAARAYLRAAPNVLGLVADYQLGGINAAEWPDLVEATLRRNPGVRRAELLREPQRFNGLSPAQYVRDFLRPGYERIRERVPGVAVVAAAPINDAQGAPDGFRRMTDAGADDFCDYRAVHVNFEDGGAMAAIARATRRPILVTETGTTAPSQHVRWYSDVVPRLRTTLGAELVFWYVLLESPLAGGPVPYNFVGASVIAADPNAAGQPQGATGSGLYDLLTGTAQTRRP